jgi:hypothetical protein
MTQTATANHFGRNQNSYAVPNGYLINPFNALYQNHDVEDNQELTVQGILDYATNLEGMIVGDFDLDEIILEIKGNFLSFVKTGLLAYKVKFFHLYEKSYKSFKDFCEQALGSTHWYINRTIEAARVVIELACNGFEVLPKCEAQCRPLTKFSGTQLCANWHTVIENVPVPKITASTIAEVLGVEQKSKTLRLSTELYLLLKEKSLEAGMSIEEFLKSLLGEDFSTEECSPERESQWQEDLEKLISEQEEQPTEEVEEVKEVEEEKTEELLSVPVEPDQKNVSRGKGFGAVKPKAKSKKALSNKRQSQKYDEAVSSPDSFKTEKLGSVIANVVKLVIPTGSKLAKLMAWADWEGSPPPPTH